MNKTLDKIGRLSRRTFSAILDTLAVSWRRIIKTYNWISQFDFKKLMEVITFTITVTGALIAIDVFTAKGSMRAYRPEGSHPIVDYNFGKIRNFYEDQGLQIPDTLATILGMKPDSDEIYGTVVSVTDVEYVKGITTDWSKRDGRTTESRIRKLENQIKRYDDYRIRESMNSYSWTGQVQFEWILEYIKEQKMPRDDYLTFLVAGINTRRIRDNIVIQNNGETDLKNVQIIIPAPTSPTSNTNLGKILHVDNKYLSDDELKQYSDKVVINIPGIWPKLENQSLDIVSQENQLDISRISFAFENERTINLQKLWKYAFIVFLLTLILTWLCPGSKL